MVGVSSNVSVGRLLEEVKLSHIPLPPPHQVRLSYKVKTAYCDLTTRTITLNPKSKSLEWDYRHEIEHLNKYPRRLKQEFIHYYKALKLLTNERDRKLFRRLRKAIANIVYDALIDTELIQKYHKVKVQVKEYLKSVVNPHILDQARMLAVQGKKDSWLDYEHPEVSFVYVSKWLKENLDKLDQFKSDYNVGVNEEDIAEAIVDLVDEEGDEGDVVREAERYLGRSVSRHKLIEALIRSRFNFIVKATFDFKIISEASREVYDIWRLGEPVDELLVREAVRSYGVVIPSHNTLRLKTVRAIHQFTNWR